VTFIYRTPRAPTVPPEAFLEAMVRSGRLYVPNDHGQLVESNDWPFFIGLWRGQRDRAADGRSQ
jgi:hypothetical protein